MNALIDSRNTHISILNIAVSSDTGNSDGMGENLKILDLMYRMSKLKARPPVIAATFGITIEKARELYRMSTGELPKRGRMPETVEWYVESAEKHLQSAWLARTYSNFSRPAKSELDRIEALILTYEQFIANFADSKITFDRFFFMVRMTFFAKDIKLSQCGKCRGVKLEVKRYTNVRHVACPSCFLIKEFKN